MKQVIRCLNCKEIIRKYGSYQVELTRPEKVGGVRTGSRVEKIQGRMCAECTHNAGYKVKRKE